MEGCTECIFRTVSEFHLDAAGCYCENTGDKMQIKQPDRPFYGLKLYKNQLAVFFSPRM